jgi:hypothetical protein
MNDFFSIKQKVIQSIKNRVYGSTNDVLLSSEVNHLKDAIFFAEEKYETDRGIVSNKIEALKNKRARALESTEDDLRRCYEDILSLTAEKLKRSAFTSDPAYKKIIQDKLNDVEKLQKKWDDIYEPYAEDINDCYCSMEKLKEPVFQSQDKLEREMAKINDKMARKFGFVGGHHAWYLEQKERQWENL